MKTQRLLLSLLAFFIMGATAWGQTITGTVTNADPSGAAICAGGTLTSITGSYTGFTAAAPTVKYEVRAVNAGGPILLSGTVVGTGNPTGTFSFSSILMNIPQGPYVIVLSTASPATSFEIPLRVDGRPTVSVTPATVCLANIAADKVTVSVVAPPSGVSYTWSDVSAPGGIAGSITPDATTAKTTATFKFTAAGEASLIATPKYATSSIGCPATAASWDGVTPPSFADYPKAKTVNLTTAVPVITKPAANTTICKGSTLTMETAVGTATTCASGLTLQWLDNGVVVKEDLVGATTTKVTYAVTPVATAYYSVRCVLKSGSTLVCSGPVSANRIITLADKPDAPKYNQPTFCQGQAIPAVFNVNQTCATGTAEWYDPRTATSNDAPWNAGPLTSFPIDATITSTVVGTFDATQQSTVDNVIRAWKLRCNNNGCYSAEVTIQYNVVSGIGAPTGVTDKVFCNNAVANVYKLDKTLTCPAGTLPLVIWQTNTGVTGAASTMADPVSTSSVANPAALKGLNGGNVNLNGDITGTGPYTFTHSPWGTGDAGTAGEADVTYFHFFCYNDANGNSAYDAATDCISPSTVGKVTELLNAPSIAGSSKIGTAATFSTGVNPTVCTSTALVLKATCPIGYSVKWNDGSTNAELTVSTAVAGVQTLTAQCIAPDAACNNSAILTFNVTVNEGGSGAPVIRANSTVCAGSPSVYAEGTCPSINWQYRAAGAGAWIDAAPTAVINGQFAFATANPQPNAPNNLTPLAPGTYEVQARCGSGACVTDFSEILTVNVGPALGAPKFAIIEPGSTSTVGAQLQLVCAGSQIKLILTDGYTCPGTMNWYAANTAGALGSGTSAIGTGNPSQLYNVPTNTTNVYISATCTVGNCMSPVALIPAALVVVVPPTMTAALTNPNATCLPPSAATSVTLKVTCPGSVGLLVPTITRAVNNGTKVTITPTSVSTAVGIISPAFPMLGVIDEYTFTVPAVAPSAAGTSQTITYEATCINPGLGGYAGAGVELQTSCQKPSATVTIATAPAAPTVTTAAIAGCGSAAFPAVTCATGSTVEWVNAAGAVVTSATVSGDYKARCVTGTCASPLSTGIITAVISPSTTAFTIKADKTTLCATGGEVVLSVATGSCPGTITWKEGTTVLGTGATITATSGAGATLTYSAECTDGTCKIAATNTVTVTRETAPTISISASATTICAGTKVTLTAMPAGMAKYEWVSVTAGVSTIIATTTTNTYELASPMGSPTQYGVMVTSANGCVYIIGETGLLALTVTDVPIITFSTNANGTICAGSGIVMSLGGCPAGATYKITNGGLSDVANGTSNGSVTLNVNAVPVGGANEITYTATCTVGGAACSATATTKVMTSPIDVRWVNVGQSETAMRPDGQGFTTTEWPTVNATSGPNAMNSSPADRSKMDYTGPRYWNLEAFYCITATPKTVEFVLVNETTSQTFKTVEGTAPWFMFGNSRSAGSAVADSYYQLWTINDPNYGFGSAYTANGLPKGLYTLTVRAISVPAATPGAYPPIRIADQDPANTIVARTFYFDIAGSQAARQGISESSEVPFVSMGMNPVTRTLSFTINGAKGQEVNLNLVDAAGRSIKASAITPETNTHREEIDMSSQNTGMYFLQVTSPSKKGVLKVLKVQE